MNEPTATAPRRQRAPRMKPEDRREHLLDTAMKLLADDGVEAVSMQGVAAAAGVAKGLGYSYFTNRDQLLLAVLQREAMRLYEHIQVEVASQESFEGAIRTALRGWFDLVEQRGNVIGLLLQSQHLQGIVRDEVAAMNRQLEEFYADLAVEAYDVPHRRAAIAAAVLIHGLDGLIDRWVSCGDDRQELEEVYVRMTIAAGRELATPQ